MKRSNRLSTSLKGYTTYNPITKNPTLKDSSYANSNNSHSYTNVSEDYMSGFPWPPRSYTCSFCRKEFKSAQALGGHMNVHRRDRARMRQSSPTHEVQTQGQGQGSMLNLNLNPTTTTNPNFSTSSLTLLPSASPSSFSSCATTLKPVTCTLPLFVSQTPPSPSFDLNRWVVVDGIVLNEKTSEAITHSKIACEDIDECRMLKKGEILRMDLEIGLPRDHYDLDLELRLGTYS